MKRRKATKAKTSDKTPKMKRVKRSGITLSSISSKIYFLIVILTALISTGLYFFTIVIPENERSQRYLDLANKTYTELAESSVVAISKKLEVIARTPNVIDSFSNKKLSDIKTLENSLTRILPKAIGIRLVQIDTIDVEVDKDRVPGITYVTLQLLRESGKGIKTPPEVVRVGQPNKYIAMVENVINTKGELVGYVLAGIDISIINEGLQNILSIPGYIEFQQEYSGTVHVLGEKGDSSLKQGKPPIIISSLEDSKWQMAYWPHPDEDFSAREEQLIFIIGLSSIFLLISIFGFLGYKRINDTLSADASTLMRLILEDPEGTIDVPKRGFQLRIFYDMAYTLQRATNDRIAKRKGRRSEKTKSTNDNTDIITSPPDMIPDSVDISDQTKDSVSRQIDGKEGISVSDNNEPNQDVSPSIFRAYDIRGVVGETLTQNAVRWIGQSIGTEAFERGEQTIIVGRDGRNSGKELITALKEGLMESGRDVIDIGMVPTPLLYFATHYLQSRSGVMLTGSHNPPDYNGLKIVLAGDTLHGEEITELYNRIKRRDLLSGEGSESNNDIMAEYINNITGDIALAQPLKVVIDAGNGVAGNVAPLLFQALGCEVVGLYCEVDGNFPNHHPDPSKPENLEDLRQAVIKEQADIGIAFDGDGDRLGVVDSQANIIWADRQMMLFSKDVLSRHPGADIIFDVKCSRHLQQLIKQNNGHPIMWRTGHSFIKAKMKETGALLAGEQSGHIFFKERWYGFDDGLYAAARLLEILANEMDMSAEVFANLPESISTPELNLDMADDRKFEFIEQLVTEGDFAGGKITDIDGVRVDYSTGWGLVRASNTTPSLVIRFEAETEKDLKNIQAVFRQQLMRFDNYLQLPF